MESFCFLSRLGGAGFTKPVWLVPAGSGPNPKGFSMFRDFSKAFRAYRDEQIDAPGLTAALDKPRIGRTPNPQLQSPTNSLQPVHQEFHLLEPKCMPDPLRHAPWPNPAKRLVRGEAMLRHRASQLLLHMALGKLGKWCC